MQKIVRRNNLVESMIATLRLNDVNFFSNCSRLNRKHISRNRFGVINSIKIITKSKEITAPSGQVIECTSFLTAIPLTTPHSVISNMSSKE